MKIPASIKKRMDEFDLDQIKMGIGVEKEHDTDDELDVVDSNLDLLKIVLAHLEEDPKYYTKLKTIDEGTKMIIKENPDRVKAKKVSFYWDSKENYAFGYLNGEMKVSEHQGTTHRELGRSRRNFKYPGRFWPEKKLISFWVYPPRDSLKKVLLDIQEVHNGHIKNRDMVPGKRRRPIIILNWRIEIPAKDVIVAIKGKGETNASKYINAEGMQAASEKAIRVNDFFNDAKNSILYPIKDVLSGKPLKGMGEDWLSSVGLSVDNGQEHMKAIKQKTIVKMSPEEKVKLYNYFKEKGRLSPAEERMYRLMYHENYEMYRQLGSKKIYLVEGKYFTRQKSYDIITEMPYVIIGEKEIDLEFEKDKVAGLKKIIKATMKEEITDKHGNHFKLETPQEIDEFVNRLMKNPQVRGMLK